ncbi:MAG: MotA/TolQ/ExbB proton channel family protein [Bacteroidales bacterium]|nr:MotA/TolQ/ExbB proton channel family protein [Bacteroidales bacterium]
MKKRIVLLSILSVFMLVNLNVAFAQTKPNAKADTIQKDTTKKDTAKTTAATTTMQTTEPTTEKTFHQVLKEKFIEGGAGWMTPILLVLVLGLAIVIERIIYLNLSRINTQKFLEEIEKLLQQNNVDGAKELARNTRGPVASIVFQGLDRYHEGIENIEKAVVTYGEVQMGRLESGLSWIGLFIALSPMLGFLGTVVGMVQAFDDIEKAGDISPTIVAGGMKVALLTTVFGLISAIILQLLYSVVVSLIESLVNQMEDASISFMDIIYKIKK